MDSIFIEDSISHQNLIHCLDFDKESKCIAIDKEVKEIITTSKIQKVLIYQAF
jgi:orotidine-5'-phosphate decarboxylase|tara:strand:+ start:5246 stop:5404 length:159 start_codon:yes stop_codon:yes gene_type:complete